MQSIESFEALDFKQFNFHPVIDLSAGYQVLDLSQGPGGEISVQKKYWVGKYNELRPQLYSADQYLSEDPDRVRNIHMAVDIGAPAGTPIHAFSDGEVFCVANNNLPLDYGHTLITMHKLNDHQIWVLYGHLQKLLTPSSFKKGDIIAHVGDSHENGGWPPHLHLQISLEEPETCDMPGVVSRADHKKALRVYPDPCLILGPLY